MCPDCKTTKKTSLLLVIIILAIAGIVTSGAFASPDHDHSAHNMGGDDSMSMNKGHTALSKPNNKTLAALEVYEELHKAFYDYDNQKILRISKRLSDILNEISSKKIQMKIKNKNIIKYLKSIKLSGDRSINNSLFNMVSRGIFESLVSGNILTKNYSQYYCPMVKKNWIQNTTKMTRVHNPYASGMPHCGSVK